LPTPTWNIEWLNHNSQRRYPLFEDGGVADVSGTFEIPNDFIVEMDIPVHVGMDVDPARFFIKHIGSYATGFSIIVGYQPESGDAVDVASALVAEPTHSRNQTDALGGVGDFADTTGKVVIGKLESIQSQPSGLFTFTIDQTRLDPDAVRPILRGISSIQVRDGNTLSPKLFGDIELQPFQNMQIVPVIVSGQDPILRFSAVEGAGLAEECLCEGDVLAPPIRRINGIPPTPAGDFTFLGNTCLVPRPIQNGLLLDDVCSEPCCGCEELEAITRDLESFGAKATTLENFLVRLESSVQQMDSVVLSAQLRDKGCIDCE
jgi:hypothetical protein